MDAILFAVFALLLAIDYLVNGTLYDYGLVFSDNWAQPYWLMFRISMGLTLAAIFILSLVELPTSIFDEMPERNQLAEPVLEVAAQGAAMLEEGDTVALSPKPTSVTTKKRKRGS